MFKALGELERAKSTFNEPKQIQAYCPACKKDSDFVYIGCSNEIYNLITPRAIEVLGSVEAFIERFGKDYKLYDCLGCHSSQTLKTLANQKNRNNNI